LDSLLCIRIKLHTGIFKFITHFFTLAGLSSRNKLFWIVIKTANIGWTLISLFNQFLEKQVVSCSYLIVFISLNALFRITFLKTKFFIHSVKNSCINWNRIDTNLYSFEISLTRHNFEPGMIPDLTDSQSFLRIRI